jgi:hypothetical protein
MSIVHFNGWQPLGQWPLENRQAEGKRIGRLEREIREGVGEG